MKKTISVILLTLALGAFAFSQAGGGGGGGQGRGQRGGQRGGGFNTAGAQYRLLARSDVTGELKITDDQKTKLATAQTDMRTASQVGQDATQEERMAARTKASEAYNTTVSGILTADQGKRLLGIFVQMTPKNQALENPDVQSALGFSSDQTAKVKDLVTKYGAANRSLSQDDPTAAADARAKNLDTLSTDLMNVLTDDQKTKLTAVTGDKFTPDPSIRGFGGAGGGGRGGAGGGGRRGGGGGAGGNGGGN